MAIIKDMILSILFICMFGVLLIFAYLSNDLRSMVLQDDIIIMAQVKVVEQDLIKIREQDHEINSLRCLTVDLQESLLMTQRKKNLLEDKLEEARAKISDLATEIYTLKKKLDK